MSHPTDQCVRCGQTGHVSASCPTLPPRAAFPSAQQHWDATEQLQEANPQWPRLRCETRALIEWQKAPR